MEISEAEKTGNLSIRDRMMIRSFGKFLIWVGQSLLKIKTYEDIKEMGPIVCAKIGDLEKKYPELSDGSRDL